MSVTPPSVASNAASTATLRYEVLERRCREMGVAENDLARGELLGVSRHTVLRWRNGQHGIALQTAARIADIIGVRLDLLIDADATKPGTPPPSPPPPQPSGPEPTHPPARSAP